MTWKWGIISFRRLGFPAVVLVFYLVLWLFAPEKTLMALKSSGHIFLQILPPLGLVFLLMAGLNLFLKPSRVTKHLGQGLGFKQILLAVIAGIISTGPIYAWYPMLKDLRQKGARHSLLAVFLVNRAVKPLLLPVMVSFFGWIYVLSFTVLIMVGSLGVGVVMGSLLDLQEESGVNN